MGKVVRCKFKCVSKTERQHWNHAKGGKLFDYAFDAVTDGSEENRAFFEATPNGALRVGSVVDGSFEVGAEYYLDLSVAGEVA